MKFSMTDSTVAAIETFKTSIIQVNLIVYTQTILFQQRFRSLIFMLDYRIQRKIVFIIMLHLVLFVFFHRIQYIALI